MCASALKRRCRSLRGNVDRNTAGQRSIMAEIVVPYVGTWIEIGLVATAAVGIPVVPYVGTWIEIRLPRSWRNYRRCRSLRGNVDRNTEECF